MAQVTIDAALDDLKAHKLTLTTAKSCTTGRMATLLKEKVRHGYGAGL